MSDQHMNASDQGTQPDSGSAPNDQVTMDAQGGGGRSAPESHGSAPQEQVGSTRDADAGSAGNSGGPGGEASRERDVTLEAHRKGQDG